MKVILLEDVKSLGKKGEIVEVNDGYARNFLLKTKKGAEANKSNMNDLKLAKAHDAKVAAEQLARAEQLKVQLENSQVTVSIKVGEGGRTFGSVSAKEIADAVKEQLGIEIDKKKLQLENPIRELGTATVLLKLHTKVTASLKVAVKEA